MSHLQNKPYAYQPIQTRSRECAITRSRYKMMEKNAQAEVFYSDEDDSRTHRQKYQIEDIIKQAQGQIRHTAVAVKEEHTSNNSSKPRRTRAQMKKKQSKGKNPSTPPTSSPDFPPLSTAAILPINQPPVPVESSPAHKPDVAQKPPVNVMSLQAIQQSQPNNLDFMKNLIEQKFVALQKLKKPSQKVESPFYFVPDYRANFEKQIKLSYEEYQQNREGAAEKAIDSKVSQLVKQEEVSKSNLLKRLEENKSLFSRSNERVVHSIAEGSNYIPEGEPAEKSIMSIACPFNLNESLSNLNQFTAVNQNFSNELSQLNKNKTSINNSQNAAKVTPSATEIEQTNSSRDRRRKEKVRVIEGSQRTIMEDQPHEHQIRQNNRNIEAECSGRSRNPKTILAQIQVVNKECAEDQRYLRIQNERLQRERENKERAKMAKKEQQSNASSSFQPLKSQGNQEEIERRRIETMKDPNWFSYHSKTNPKIKRLQILNRYHYNPFEENEGEDQCELWKKLMGMEIKNIKNEHPIKNEEYSLIAIDSFVKDCLNEQENVFILSTNYKPQPIEEKKQEEEEDFEPEREKKTKPIKKQKKKKNKDSKDSKSGEKDNKQPSNNEPEIEDFLNLERPVNNIKEEFIQPTCQPKLEYLGGYSHTSREIEASHYQPPTSLNYQNDEPIFNYDQLPALEGMENVKHDDDPNHDEPFFGSDAHHYRDIDYYENLANRGHN